MPLPLPIASTPSAWESFIAPSEAAGPEWEWLPLASSPVLPAALFLPLAPVLGWAGISGGENFLAGLQVEKVLGVADLPTAQLRRVPLVWVGVALAGAGAFFQHLRAGCWVCGFPAVGRGRDLLRLGNLADAPGLQAALGEVGQAAPVSAQLYFNFHYDEPAAACERVYVLDAGAGRLHGFAFPRSALAPAKLK